MKLTVQGVELHRSGSHYSVKGQRYRVDELHVVCAGDDSQVYFDWPAGDVLQESVTLFCMQRHLLLWMRARLYLCCVLIPLVRK